MNKAIFDSKAKPALIKYCFLFLFLVAAKSSIAQTRGKVQVVAPPLFDTLLARRASAGNGKAQAGGGVYVSSYGYRVQIFSGTSRKAAYSAQAKCNREFPDMRTYIAYREPNFKIRAGDFRTRLEAERMREQLKAIFPITFIVSEKINPPKTVISND
jgi:hypothetical protein